MMMLLPYAPGLAGALLAAIAILTLFAALRSPKVLLGGSIPLRMFYHRGLLRFRMFALVFLSLLPMIAAQRLLDISKTAPDPASWIANPAQFLVPFALILGPVVLARIFRVFVMKLVARARSPMSGLNPVFFSYALFAILSAGIAIQALDLA